MLEHSVPPGISGGFTRVGDILLAEVRRTFVTQKRTPLLMVHGAFHGWWAYRRWLGTFASLGFPSYALSWRGHEGSVPLTSEQLCATGMADYADDVEAAMASIGEPLTFIHKPGAGIQVDVNGAAKGTIKGDDFARALLSIWLGPQPPNLELKSGLLGGACG